MQKKAVKYFVTVLLIVFVAYNSVYFKKLDEVKLASSIKGFDAGKYARNFYDKKLLPQLGTAVEVSQLVFLLESEPNTAFKNYSHALDIGNLRYFLVQGQGVVSSIGDDDVTVDVKTDSAKATVKLATEFVYGNAIRDGSGQINLNEFDNTADFNSVSEEINKIIRKEVIPPFKASVKQGDNVKFSGAIELNQAHLNLASIEVVPVQLSIVK